MTPLDRRRFLSLSAGALGAAVLSACGQDLATPEPADEVLTGGASPAPTEALPVLTPTPEPEPPVMPRGHEVLVLAQGTEYEATGLIFHSGRPGPRFMVLGGVHGNEPGGWMAAESIAEWEVQQGVLIVLPRLNHRSAAAFERTLDGYGDLNRLYPGDRNGPPMAHMAADVVAIAEEWRPHWLFDLHESWGFFNERGANGGTAFIGQTVTSAGPATALDFVSAAVEAVNGRITTREQLTMRNRPGGNFGGGGAFGDRDDLGNFGGRRGSSSLSLGRFVPGLNPVLVEMGQMNQPESRRSELHQMLVREMLDRLEMT
ncbi:MAG: hypothetical protein AMXMBFR23_16140 [Chloroflexota bacterium]